jgi:hypothetical protein
MVSAMHVLRILGIILVVYLSGVVLFLSIIYGLLAIDRRRSPRARPLPAALEDLGGAARVEWETPGAEDAEYRLEGEFGESQWNVEYDEAGPGLYSAKDESPNLIDGGEVT